MSKRSTKLIFGFLLITGVYIALISKIVFSNTHLSHDNFTYHFWSFYYFGSYLSNEFKFPNILYDLGGSEVAITSISMGYFSPHRLIGYLLYSLVPLSPAAGHKMTILIGIIINAFGWFLVWNKVFPKGYISLFCTCSFYLGGIGLTIWHQEQILFTLAYAPWFVFCCFDLKKYKFLAAALLGASLTLHYPQIHLMTFIFSAVFLLLINLNLKVERYKNNWLIVFWFLITAAPLIYIYSIQHQYCSPLRGTLSLSASSIQEYIRINEIQMSSVPIGYLKSLFWPTTKQTDDSFIFVVNPAVLFFIAISLISIKDKIKSKIFLIGLGLFLLFCSFGINSFIPQILFQLNVPTISSFRQWYHISPFFVITCITLSGFGFMHFIEGQKKGVVFLTYSLSLISLIVLFSIVQSTYQKVTSDRPLNEAKRLSSLELSQKILKKEFKIPPDLPGEKPLVALVTSDAINKGNPNYILISDPSDPAIFFNNLVTAKYLKTGDNNKRKISLFLNSELFLNKDIRSNLPKEDYKKVVEDNKIYYFRGGLFYKLLLMQQISIFALLFWAKLVLVKKSRVLLV